MRDVTLCVREHLHGLHGDVMNFRFFFEQPVRQPYQQQQQQNKENEKTIHDFRIFRAPMRNLKVKIVKAFN